MESENQARDAALARRDFMIKAGKLAAVTPPLVSVLLASTRNSYATASSGNGHVEKHANNGFGNGGNDGVPGHSDHEDDDR